MSEIHDLIIVGSGPAGLAAAIYASRARLDTLVIEKDPMSGGQVLTTYEVDNYPGLPGINGFDLGTRFRKHAEDLQTVFVKDEVRKVEAADMTQLSDSGESGTADVDLTRDRSLEAAELHPAEAGFSGRIPDSARCYRIVGKKAAYLTKTVIIASGASHRKLGVPGEEAFAGAGVSYCATCDGAFYRKRTTAVVGGGDVAIEDAIYLARMCEHVYLIHRRDELRGARSLQEKLFSMENVTVIWDTEVTEICGKMGVESLHLKNKKSREESELAVDGVFIAVGITPNSGAFEGLTDMEQGYIIADETGVTGTPGIFAAGDVRTKKLRQIITAAADGANAVASAEQYLMKTER
jgi:thioredoxin reductase (NADPH)